jgi:hypothetical protein
MLVVTTELPVVAVAVALAQLVAMLVLIQVTVVPE